jgi:hypothetical protein
MASGFGRKAGFAPFAASVMRPVSGIQEPVAANDCFGGEFS